MMQSLESNVSDHQGIAIDQRSIIQETNLTQRPQVFQVPVHVTSNAAIRPRNSNRSWSSDCKLMKQLRSDVF
jgi:hypothetical protein